MLVYLFRGYGIYSDLFPAPQGQFPREEHHSNTWDVLNCQKFHWSVKQWQVINSHYLWAIILALQPLSHFSKCDLYRKRNELNSNITPISLAESTNKSKTINLGNAVDSKYARVINAGRLIRFLYFARDRRGRCQRYAIFNHTKFYKTNNSQTWKHLGVFEYLKGVARSSQRNIIRVINFCLEQVKEHAPSRTKYANLITE